MRPSPSPSWTLSMARPSLARRPPRPAFCSRPSNKLRRKRLLRPGQARGRDESHSGLAEPSGGLAVAVLRLIRDVDDVVLILIVQLFESGNRCLEGQRVDLLPLGVLLGGAVLRVTVTPSASYTPPCSPCRCSPRCTFATISSGLAAAVTIRTAPTTGGPTTVSSPAICTRYPGPASSPIDSPTPCDRFLEFRRKSSRTRRWNSSTNSWAVCARLPAASTNRRWYSSSWAGLHDPIGEEPVARELVEPPSRRSDPSPHRGYELVHRPREELEPHCLLHQHRRLADVGGHHEHLDRFVVDDRVEELVPTEPFLPVGRRVGLQEPRDAGAFLVAFRGRDVRFGRHRTSDDVAGRSQSSPKRCRRRRGRG